jgi:transcriptional regulator with XRE-family HTH domain
MRVERGEELRLLVSAPDTRQTGVRIREARKEVGLTQKALASALGVSVRSVQNYESGTIVPYRHLREIEAILRKPHGWLLDGDAYALTASVEDLQQAVQQHSQLLRDQLELLERNLQRLRDLRVKGVERRRSRGSGRSGGKGAV